VARDVAYPDWRAPAVSVYRLWRDGGYAVGPALAGVLADSLGVSWAIGAIAALTFASAVVVLGRMYETLPGHQPGIVTTSPGEHELTRTSVPGSVRRTSARPLILMRPPHAADELAEYLLERAPLEPRGHFARQLDFGVARNASERPVSLLPAERAQLVARCEA
jgi:MFS family permease